MAPPISMKTIAASKGATRPSCSFSTKPSPGELFTVWRSVVVEGRAERRNAGVFMCLPRHQPPVLQFLRVTSCVHQSLPMKPARMAIRPLPRKTAHANVWLSACSEGRGVGCGSTCVREGSAWMGQERFHTKVASVSHAARFKRPAAAHAAGTLRSRAAAPLRRPAALLREVWWPPPLPQHFLGGGDLGCLQLGEHLRQRGSRAARAAGDASCGWSSSVHKVDSTLVTQEERPQLEAQAARAAPKKPRCSQRATRP